MRSLTKTRLFNSISLRLILANAIVLASLMLLIFLSLQHTVYARAEQAQMDRMQGLVYGILGASELTSGGQLLINTFSLPDERLRQPESGLSAAVYDSHKNPVWTSESQQFLQHKESTVRIGRWRFQANLEDTDAPWFSLRFGFSWSDLDGEEKAFNLLLVESAGDYLRQMTQLEHGLWVTLITSALVLLLLQFAVLYWGLRPLASMSQSLKMIQDGRRESIDTRLPGELQPVASSLNALLQSERNRQKQYRNVIDDLAHSLKTPLAVMQNLSQHRDIPENEQRTLAEQSTRMKEIIAYHIKRAASRGHRPLGQSVAIAPLVSRLCNSLGKVYAQKNMQFENSLRKELQLRADEADLLEIFGNLMENACKYGKGVVHVSGENKKDGSHEFVIEDNGPGFPQEYSHRLMMRGRRADRKIEGQGIGLAIAGELLAAYGGSIEIGHSEKLGGARVVLHFSATM